MTGRPSKYNKNLHIQLARLCGMAGLTDKEIAKEMGIAESTLNKWKIDYPEFMESLKQGKEKPDSLVEAKLFDRANGNIILREKTIDKNGNETIKLKEIPPDVTAQIFWLKNRKPDKWREKQEVEHSSKEPIQINFIPVGKKD